MYTHFEFKDHSNPYIATTNDSFFWMFCHYDVERINDIAFYVHGERPKHITGYRDKQSLLRDIAIEWQMDFADRDYSWGELLDWQSFFETMGKRYGLLREFKENCIC